MLQREPRARDLPHARGTAQLRHEFVALFVSTVLAIAVAALVFRWLAGREGSQ